MDGVYEDAFREGMGHVGQDTEYLLLEISSCLPSIDGRWGLPTFIDILADSGVFLVLMKVGRS